MKLFNCKVRIMGEVKDEVVRDNVTNAEIKILRSIHGDDGVVSVEPTGAEAMTGYVDYDADGNAVRKQRPRSEAEERQRLEMFYGEPAVAKLFGIAVPRIADEPSAIEDVLGATISLEPPVRAEVQPIRAASKKLQLEGID